MVNKLSYFNQFTSGVGGGGGGGGALAVGSYPGDGTIGRTIVTGLPSPPVVVHVTNEAGAPGGLGLVFKSSAMAGATAYQAASGADITAFAGGLTIAGNDFVVDGPGPPVNDATRTYTWAAWA